jgi:hypothetical protein
MCDDIAAWGREMARPENERSPTALAHESARAQRMADFFEDHATDSLMQGAPGMAHLILAVALEMARKRGLGISPPAVSGWRAGCVPSPLFLRCKGRSRPRPEKQDIAQKWVGHSMTAISEFGTTPTTGSALKMSVH